MICAFLLGYAGFSMIVVMLNRDNNIVLDTKKKVKI